LKQSRFQYLQERQLERAPTHDSGRKTDMLAKAEPVK
jgi:hypothetical protein